MHYSTRSCFVDDTAILAESFEVLVMALEAMNEDTKPLELRSFGPRTRYICLETYRIKHPCRENIDILKNTTHTDNVVYSDCGPSQEIYGEMAWPAVAWTIGLS